MIKLPNLLIRHTIKPHKQQNFTLPYRAALPIPPAPTSAPPPISLSVFLSSSSPLHATKFTIIWYTKLVIRISEFNISFFLPYLLRVRKTNTLKSNVKSSTPLNH